MRRQLLNGRQTLWYVSRARPHAAAGGTWHLGYAPPCTRAQRCFRWARYASAYLKGCRLCCFPIYLAAEPSQLSPSRGWGTSVGGAPERAGATCGVRNGVCGCVVFVVVCSSACIAAYMHSLAVCVRGVVSSSVTSKLRIAQREPSRGLAVSDFVERASTSLTTSPRSHSYIFIYELRVCMFTSIELHVCSAREMWRVYVG